MRRGATVFALLLGAASAMSAGCATNATVTRAVHGRLVSGRFVSDEAYAAYLRGAVLEAKGLRDGALVAYGDGARHDPNSPELWTRIGELACAAPGARGPSGAEIRPEAAFDRAAALDPNYEEAWTARARCHMKRGELGAAARAARTAVSLDPGRIEPPVLLAQILERQGEMEEATRWLQGLVIRNPESLEAQEAFGALAARNHDPARQIAAKDAVNALRRSVDPEPPFTTARATIADVDAAIAARDFERARKLSLSAKLASGALAVRAAAVGEGVFAKAEATLVLLADPDDVDARVAAVVAADLLRDDDALAAALAHTQTPRRAMSALAALLMGEVLERRVGRDARRAWDAFPRSAESSDDALVKRVAERR